MKRREMLRLIPVSIAGLTGTSTVIRASEEKPVGANPRFAEPLAIRYLHKVRDRLTWIRQTQTEDLMEGAYAIARTIENGGTCWQLWDAGHTNTDIYPDRNGLPEIFTNGYDPEKAGDGDLVLARAANEQLTDDLAKKDIFVIGAPSPWSGDAQHPELLRDAVRKLQLWPYADVWIETQATTFGGVIKVPGMTAPIGPVTGVTGPVMMWMMAADACRVLARRGKSLPVNGDEPKVTGERVDWQGFSGWVSLNDPLMDNYFDEVMDQIELIGAEMGKIRLIASMAMDAVMNGGRIYCYSRFSSIAQDANTRRSGLSITRGLMDRDGVLWDGQKSKAFDGGTSKDCVIMGILKPDDPVDLKYLDYFRGKGMKVASLGPMTRAMHEPGGRTVPKETDVHAGRMCDTYGLFAVPGFEQKICPTSGVILNQLFWAVMMELVEQYMDRTGGDIPGVYFSAGLKGGREHYRKWYNLDQEKH
ncbi:MAG: hypothetical protein J7M24_08085 [Candidatus Latescibacteria bacterium]|nr:hypothetical protein [Candidatus Latescibacterota bacterium]